MCDQKLKHLEFIQNVITRMNTNSFYIKGWTVTLISGLFVLSAKDSNISIIQICYFVIPIFWCLDGFYLAQERRYRALYHEVTLKSNQDIDFNMNASDKVKINKCIDWFCGIFSKTLIPYYVICIAAVIIVHITFITNT